MTQNFQVVISEDFQSQLRDELMEMAKVELERMKNDLLLEEMYLNQDQLMKSMRVGKTTVDSWIADGLPVIPVGNRKMFKKSDVVNFLDTIKI